MANKKLLYVDSSGSIREMAQGVGSSATYYDDPTADVLYAKNITFTTMSFNNGDFGLPIIRSGSLRLTTPAAGTSPYVGWDNINRTWTLMPGQFVDITASVAGINSDLSGTFGTDIKVKNLSNVITGVLPVEHGGTGLGSGSEFNNFSSLNAEAILLGNGTGSFTFLSPSQATSALALASDGTNWSYITQSLNNKVEVQVYTTPGTHFWTASIGTKAIRVLAQGGGGGGGSGANRNSGVAALGGTGGSAGAFVDSGYTTFNDTGSTIIVGAGGVGANYSNINAAGLNGSDGESSSFGDIIFANGGRGGSGGNINSSITSSGGDSVTASANIYDNFIYNQNKIINSSDVGANNSTTAGSDRIYREHLYYGNSGGGSGGSLVQSNYITNYNGGAGDSAGLLMHFDTLTCSVDSSRTLSLTANAMTSSFSKFGQNSIKFTGPAVRSATMQSVNLPTNFTIEFWLYLNSYGSNSTGTDPYNIRMYIMGTRNSPVGSTSNYTLFLGKNGRLIYYLGTSGFGPARYSDLYMPTGSWCHVAYVRNNSNIDIYLNGIKNNSMVNSAGASASTDTVAKTAANPIVLGSADDVTAGQELYYLDGYIDELKITPAALYTSNFIPPNKEFTNPVRGTITALDSASPFSSSVNDLIYNAVFPEDIYVAAGGGGGASAAVTETFDSGTLLLTHFNVNDTAEEAKDYSVYKNSYFTSSASTVITSNVGYPANSTKFTNGILSSSRDTSSANLNFYAYPGVSLGTSNWSYEGWFYLINSGSSTDIDARTQLMSIGAFYLVINSAGRLRTYSSGAYQTATALTMPLNQWAHVCLQRSGSTSARIYVNATASAIITIPAGATANGVCALGSNGQYNMNGYAKELRIVNRAIPQSEIISYYNDVIANNSGSYDNPMLIQGSYAGGLGGNGAWGSGGGAGGASTNNTTTAGDKQGGNGGNGYVAVISYKY